MALPRKENPLAERFRRVLSHVGPGPVDLGIPPVGTLRPLLGDFRDAGKSSLLSVFWAYDRTLSEWISLITEYRYAFSLDSWPPFLKKPTTSSFYRWDQATELEKLFLKNQRMRWIVRKFISRVRRRVMEKRIVGDTDLYTTLPIPDNQVIRVYDVKTRSVYCFHMHTMVKLMSRSLLYSSYAIASPHTPKNPYTNIPWNIGQIISIVSQLLITGAQYCQTPSLLLTDYRASNFNIKTFLRNHSIFLNTQAAITFFSNLDDGDTKAMFLETYDDLAAYVNDPMVYNKVLRVRKILEKLTDKVLLKKWTDLITSFWIFYTHRFMWKWNTITDLVLDYRRIQHETYLLYRPKPAVPITNITILVDGDPYP